MRGLVWRGAPRGEKLVVGMRRSDNLCTEIRWTSELGQQRGARDGRWAVERAQRASGGSRGAHASRGAPTPQFRERGSTRRFACCSSCSCLPSWTVDRTKTGRDSRPQRDARETKSARLAAVNGLDVELCYMFEHAGVSARVSGPRSPRGPVQGYEGMLQLYLYLP